MPAADQELRQVQAERNLEQTTSRVVRSQAGRGPDPVTTQFAYQPYAWTVSRID